MPLEVAIFVAEKILKAFDANVANGKVEYHSFWAATWFDTIMQIHN